MSRPDADQALLRELARKHADWATERNMDEEGAVTQQLAAGGIAVHEPSQADVDRAVAAMQPYWKEWAAQRNPDTQKALAAAMKAIGM